MISIYWNSGPSAGFTDRLPSWWFVADGEQSSLDHDVQGPGRRRPVAKCSIRVEGAVAELNYGGQHAGHNEPNFPIGVMRLIFNDSSRTSLKKVQWRFDNSHTFENVDVEVTDVEIACKTLTTFDPVDIEDGRKKIKKMVALRQGQPAFRAALMDAYESRCAITGCTIKDVLEAAHISPYLGDHTNHVTNGLLLRADIHTLFDRGLIKVDVDYRITAPEHIGRTYDLPETIRLPANSAYHPNRVALDMKWRGD